MVQFGNQKRSIPTRKLQLLEPGKDPDTKGEAAQTKAHVAELEQKVTPPATPAPLPRAAKKKKRDPIKRDDAEWNF
jgi:hypothetical protein